MSASVAAAVLLTLVAALAASGPVAGAATPVPGRTAVVGIEAEPPCLNAVLDGCFIYSTHWIAGTTLLGAFRVLPDSTYEPMLVDRVDVETQPFALTYRIKKQAVWSDGRPVTADDFIFTLDAIRDPGNATTNARSGFEFVTESVRVDAKTFTLRFSRPYPNWESLFPVVLPKHVLQGHDLDQVFRDEIADPITHAPIGSGPFLVTSWTKGQSLTVARNPRWWGHGPPLLDGLEFRFLPFFNGTVQGISDGSLDVAFFAQPEAGIADLQRLDGIEVESVPGRALEHLDFNLQSTDMPLLRETWFRQAVALSIDRDAVGTSVYGTLVPGYTAPQHLSFSSLQPEYEPAFARYVRDPHAVAALMLGHGCFLGGDGIWSCGGTRASVKVATTTGNQTRELMQQQMAAQARAAGIELVPDNSTPFVLFATRLPARQYELILFNWIIGDGAPAVRALYGCNGDGNFMGYCSPAVTDLGTRVETEADRVLRAQLVNDANRILAEDVPTIPLLLRPMFLAAKETLHGPEVNPFGLATWNAETWRFESDATPPETVASASPVPNTKGWNAGTVTVELAAVDADPGVEGIRYSLTGAQTGEGVIVGRWGTVTVSSEGVTKLTFHATDGAGNAEKQHKLVIRIDRTAPAVTCLATPDRLTPPNGRLARVDVDVSVADELSGPAGFVLTGATSDEPHVDDIDGFVVGKPDTHGHLRAESAPSGDGRTYALEYTGADRAGNTTSCMARIEVLR